MSKRNPRAKWVLPEIINPPKKICFQIQVPDEKYHIAAFLGALYNLTSAIFWSDDSAHTAKDVARVWQNIYDNISRQCVTEFINTYVALEDDMPFFRQVCENDVCYLEFECCPGEWVRLGNANQIPAATQPGSTAPQPAPAGGHVDYPCTILSANGRYLIPTVVSTGDVINFTADGSGNDGGEIQWRCADGATYFAGACNEGETRLDGADPIPTQPHMALILNIAGTFYWPGFGGFTVPGGISNAQVYIQVNDSAIGNNAGSYSVCASVTNNQAATWTHEFFVDVNSSGWSVITPAAPCAIPFGQWTAGSGFESTLAQCTGPDNAYRSIAIRKLFSHRIITSLSVTNVFVAGSVVAGQTSDLEGKLSGTLKFDQSVAAGISPGSPWTWSGSQDCDELIVSFVAGYCSGICDPGGSILVTKIVIQGVGTDPF